MLALRSFCAFIVVALCCSGLVSAAVPKREQTFSMSVRPNDKLVTIAYFIQISEPTITLLPRLLRVLYDPSNTYIVHFDKKIPEWQRTHAASSLFNSDKRYEDNVHILPSESVTYRGISMVLNSLNAMQAAADHSADWTYFINISGSDYPLLSPTNQRRLLSDFDFAERKRSFFSISPKDWWTESKTYRYDRLFTDTSLSFNESEHRIVDSYTDQPLSTVHNFTFVAAEAWMLLHRDFVDFLLKSPFSRRMLLAFAYALEPEEHYFAVVAYNTPRFNDSTVPHALRHVEWVHNGKHSGQHPYYVDALDDDGKTWSFQHKIENSGCFFTRKIRNKDATILEYLDKHVNGVHDKAVTNDVDRYFKLTRKKLECVSQLTIADYADVCFHNDEVEEHDAES